MCPEIAKCFLITLRGINAKSILNSSWTSKLGISRIFNISSYQYNVIQLWSPTYQVTCVRISKSSNVIFLLLKQLVAKVECQDTCTNLFTFKCFLICDYFCKVRLKVTTIFHPLFYLHNKIYQFYIVLATVLKSCHSHVFNMGLGIWSIICIPKPILKICIPMYICIYNPYSLNRQY